MKCVSKLLLTTASTCIAFTLGWKKTDCLNNSELTALVMKRGEIVRHLSMTPSNTLMTIAAYVLVALYLFIYLNPDLAFEWGSEIWAHIKALWFRVPVGTRSILVGAHAFWFHPFVVAAAWHKTYGFPLDPRLWVAFFVHDLGYIGKTNMDGPEGEKHPELGARIMHRLFDDWVKIDSHKLHREWDWHDFSLYHSRTYAKLHGAEVSKLCYADKLAFTVQSKWLYLALVKITGEYEEYLDNARKYNASLGYVKIRTDNLNNWYDDLVTHFYSVIKPFEQAA